MQLERMLASAAQARSCRSRFMSLLSSDEIAAMVCAPITQRCRALDIGRSVNLARYITAW